MSKPVATRSKALPVIAPAIAPLGAPVLVSEISCERCPIGCSSEFYPVEPCPLVPRDYPSGALLASRGEPADYLHFVKRGAVAGSWHGRDAQLLFGAGSVVGLECLVSDTRLVTAWTLAPTSVCGIARASLGEWLERRGELADALTDAAHALVSNAKRQRQCQ